MPQAPRSHLKAPLVSRPWRLLALFAGIVLPLAVAAQLAQDILRRETLSFDEPILFAIHARSTPTLDRVFAFLSQAGGFPGTALAAVAGGVWLWRKARSRACLFWVLAMGGAGALNVVVKLFFKRERPTLWVPFAPEHDYSFPSGHSMLAASLALAVLLMLWPTKWRVPAIFFAVLWPLTVGLSRLYIGVHFPSDVLAGWCAGSAWTTGVYFILRGERDRFFERAAGRSGPQVLAGGSAPLEALGTEESAPEKMREAARSTPRGSGR